MPPVESDTVTDTERLRYWLHASGLTKSRLARDVFGVSRRALYYWRDGQPMPLGFRDRLHRIVSITHDRDTVTVTVSRTPTP